MSSGSSSSLQARVVYLPAALAVFLYVALVLRCAWLADDAYISFRTVDNFVCGRGLTWNVAERVQTYTHPLWMLLLSGVYALTREINLTAILISVILSVAAVLIFVGRVAVGAFPALIGVTVFALSKAFVDYSTSGLENPLTHLLLMIFLLTYLTLAPDRKTLWWLALLAGLLTLNRMDTALLVLPAIAVAWYRVRSLRSLGVVVLGFAPFIAWALFSLFYYGFLLPNTAYAKLNTGLATSELVRQGLFYMLATLTTDPLTLVVIGAGLAAPFILRQPRHAPLVVGAILYLLYVVCIGGDFMLGRFLTAPLLIAVVLLTRAAVSARTGLLTLLLIVLIGVIPERSPLRADASYGFNLKYMDEHGVGDERAFYYRSTGLLHANDKGYPRFPWADDGRAVRGSVEPVVAETIGMFGFFAGPNVHVVDQMALADPLLARLKPEPGVWRTGHFRRTIPQGYLTTLRTGNNGFSDERLAAYYDKLRLITRGALWDPHRWLETLKFNLGVYDGLVAEPGAAPARDRL